MQTLPFQKIRTLEHLLLNDVVMDDLVVVLSKHDSDQCLLVYNTETDDDLPPPPHPDRRVARLGTLHHADYANFDGPVIGLSAVDVILSGVPTHGINFYPIERIFRQKNQLEPFLRTSYRLACTLARHLAGLRGAERERKNHRGHTKIIQLSLPLLLGRHPLNNLVAVLPSKDLHTFLDLDHQGYQLIYNDPNHTHDLEWLRTTSLDHGPDGSPWVAMFEEASLFHPSLSRVVRRPVDLRTVLRQMDQADLLEAICRGLARRCWNKWETSGSPALRDAAYTLATEAWLVDEDVEGLVALFPNEDFSRFVETGDALRIYRALDPTASREPSALGPRYSMEDLLLKRIDYPAYTTTPVAFPVLAPVLRRISAEPVLDLAPILWRANHGTSLGRMFWLLSRDLLERPIPEWAQIGAELAAITDLVVRATLIYSLNDPWQWRGGRHGLFLRNCYRHLDRCLHEQSLTSEELKYYYTALREWYGCFVSDDDESSLNRMVQACRNLHDSMREQYEWLDYVRTADHLLEIGASIVQPGHRGRFRLQEVPTTEWKSEEIAEFLSTIAHSSTPTQVPSPILGQFLHLYFDLHDRWKRLQEQAFSHRPSTDDMDALLSELTHAQRVIHAPAHEMVVLLRAFNRDIEHIHRLKQSMGSGAIIKVALQNPWITLDVQETLVVNVQNLGSAGASQFRLGLDRSRGFEFLTEPHPLELPVLAPGERRRLEYRVRVKEPLLMLIFSYRYRNSTGQLYADQQHIRVEAQQRTQDVRRFTRLNPFEVGRPVSGGDHFFGRRKELEKILTRLARGSTQPLVLRGPRRIGKSSLLRQLTRILTDRQERQALGFSPELQSQISVIHPVLIDLQSIDQSISGYFQRFLNAILKDICVRLALETESIQTVLATFNQQCALDGSPSAFMDQVGVILAQRPHERLLILIDELDEVFRDEYEAVARNLRHIIQEEKRISWITTSTMIVRGYSAYGSPWFNLLEPMEMSKMDWEAATQLITVPSQKIGLEWEVEAVATVLEQAGQRPYLIQMLCARLIDHLNQQNLDRVEATVVWEVINDMINDYHATAHFLGFIWNEASWMGRLILWTLDRHSPAPMSRSEISHTIEAELQQHGLTVDRSAFNRVFDDRIDWLEKIADVVSPLKRKHYTLSIPLVQRWLQQVMAEDAGFVARALAGVGDEVQQWTAS